MPTVFLLASLAVHTYARPNYAYTDDRTPAPALLANMPEWAKGRPFTSRHARGALAVPADGEWRFRAAGIWVEKETPVPCGIRLGNVELELTDGERAVSLKRGRVPFRVYYPKYRTGKERIEWKGPGMADFEPIPDSALSHAASDETDASWQVHAAELKPAASNPHVLRYETTVAKDGFYRLRLLVRGRFRWGSVTPNHLKVVLDGEEIRTWFSTSGRGGIFDEANETVFLRAGRHRFELHGSNVRYLGRWFGGEAFDHDQEKPFEASKPLAPRVWLDFADEDAYVMRLDMPATSVYRLGEPVAWNFRAARPGRTFAVSVRELRGATSNEVWRGTSVSGRVAFPRDRAGAFEYFVLDGADGRTLEGPWEFLVVDPTPVRRAKGGADVPVERQGLLVDAVDCAAEKANAPGAHALRDNDTSKAVKREGLSFRETGPVMRYGSYGPKKRGMTETDWFAVTLKVEHPGKAHLLVANLPTDAYRRNVIELVDPVTGYYNGALHETHRTERPGFAKALVPFWPNGRTMDVLITPSSAYHGMPSTPTAVGRIELYELPDGFQPMAEAATGWRRDRIVSMSGEQGDLGPEKATTPLPWNDGSVVPTARNTPYHHHYDYKAYFEAWDRYGEYAAWNGDSRIIWPIHSYDMAHVKTRHLPWGNEIFCNGLGFTDNDRYTRDTAKLMLLACERHGIGFVGDIQLNSDAQRWGSTIRDVLGIGEDDLKGMFLSDGKQYLAQNLNPAHPLARKYLVGFYEDIAEAYGRYPAFAGIALRNLSWATSVGAWFHNYTVGYDEYTVGAFERETGAKVGGATRDERFRTIANDRDLRAKFFAWRADKTVSLRKEILAAIRRHAPDAVLLAKQGTATTPDAGAGIDGERMGRACGYGFRTVNFSCTGIENNEFEPVRMARFDIRDGVEKMDAEKKFDYRVWYGEGVNTAAAIHAPPYSTQKLAEALAEKPADILDRGTYWCLPPGDAALRAFVRAWRAIPSAENAVKVETGTDDFAVWKYPTAKAGAFALAVISLADRPLDVTVRGAVRDLVTGEGLSDKVPLAPYALRFVLATRDVAARDLAGGRPRVKKVAYRGKGAFKVETNATWSAERPYDVLVSEGDRRFGFTSKGLSYLERGGKVALSAVQVMGDKSKSPSAVFPFIHPTDGIEVTFPDAKRVRIRLLPGPKADIDTDLTAPGFGFTMFATGVSFERAYEIVSGSDTVVETDRVAWETNPGLHYQDWTGFSKAAHVRNGEYSKAFEITAFATVVKEKFAGVRTAKWDEKEKKYLPWLGWSVPWAEFWLPEEGVGFDVATIPSEGVGLELGDGLMSRLDRTVGPSDAGEHVFHRFIRMPAKRQTPEALADWASKLSFK